MILAGAARRKTIRGGFAEHSTSTAILVLVIFVFVPSQMVLRSGLAPEYASQKLSHKLFWHSVGIGFAVSDYFREKYDLQLSDLDLSMLHLVAKSPEVEALGSRGRHIFWAGTYTGNWVGSDPEIQSGNDMYYSGMVRDFGEYESVSMKVVFRLVVDNPMHTLILFAFEKPRLLLRQILNAFVPGLYSVPELMLQGLSETLASVDERIAKRIYPHLLSPLALLAIAAGAAGLSATTRSKRMSLCFLVFGAFLASLVPLLLSYPLIHLMASSLTLLILLMLIISALVVSEFVQFLTDRTQVFQSKAARV